MVDQGTRKKGAEEADDFAHDRGEGLRLALAILEAEEAALLRESPSWRTNAIREVRHKTLQVAQKRLKTALNRLTPKGETEMHEELASALDKLGLYAWRAMVSHESLVRI